MRPVSQKIVLIGGVNLNRSPKAIRPHQAALTKNMFPVVPGILSKRNGVQSIRPAFVPGFTLNPLSWALAPAITGFQYLAHFHRFIALDAEPISLLAATDLDNETATITKGSTVTVGLAQSEYAPVRFINYRNLCFAVVPGEEGFYVFGPRYVGGKPQPDYVWTKASFQFDPTIVAIQNSQAIPVQPRTGAQYKQRMVWCNFGPGMGSWIIMADKATTTVLVAPTLTPVGAIVGTDVLSYNGRHIEVGALEGEDIVCAQEVSLSAMGSQIETVLMLMSTKTCVFISGEILQTNDSGATDPNGLFGTYRENRINYECGCVSQNTLAKTPYGWIWAGPDDIWILNGNLPVRIGTNIRPALLNCPATSRTQWSAAYADGIYMLQLVTQNTTTDGGQNTEITSYLHQYWLLDLRDGLPNSAEDARWFGPMELAAEDADNLVFGHLLSFKDNDGTQHIYCLAKYGIIGTYLIDMLGSVASIGQDVIISGATSAPLWQSNYYYATGDIVRALGTAAQPNRTGRIYVMTGTGGYSGLTEPTWPLTDGGSVADSGALWTEMLDTAVQALGIALQQRQDTEYQVDFRSRDSALDESVHEKLLRRVDVNISAPNKMQIAASAILNQGSEAKSLETNTFGNVSPELGVDVLPVAIGGVKSVSRTFRPEETELIQARQLQLKLQDNNSYIIDEQNDYFNLAFWIDDSGDLILIGFLQVQLTRGAYASINDLLTHIVARLNANKALISNIPSIGGISLGATPFSYSDAYASSSPYFTRIALAYTSMGSVVVVSPVFDVEPYTGGQLSIVGDSSTVLYLDRAKRLGTLLGFDTTRNTYDAATLTNFSLLNNPTAEWATVASSPLHIDGSAIVQKKNSTRFDISEAVMIIQPKVAFPLVNKDRP